MAAVVQAGGGSTSASLTTGITNEVKKTSTSSGLKSNVTSKSTGVRGASLTPIYNRLNDTSLNRPMSANTFSDWSIEAGDTVTVKRDGNSYESQVHSTSLIWRGAPQIEMNSTGNEERDAVSKIKKQKYARGGVGSRIAGNQYNYEMNQEHLMYEVFNEDGRMSHFEVNLDGLHHTVSDQDGRISTLVNDVDGLHHTVSTAEGKISVLENTADGFRTRIEKVVDSSGKIKAAEIATAINDGGSHVYIEADKIHLLGDTIAKKVTASYIGTTLTNSSVLSTRYAFSTTLECKKFICNDYTCAVEDAIYALKLEKSGNTYTLKYKHFYSSDWANVPGGNFSRAVDSWGQRWSGGNFTVTAQPQGNTCWTAIVGGSESWSGRTVTIPIKAYNSNYPGTEVSTGCSVSATFSLAKSDISIPTSWSSSSKDPDGDVKVSLNKNYTYHKCTVNVLGVTKTIRVVLT